MPRRASIARKEKYAPTLSRTTDKIVVTWRQTPRFCGAPGIDTWRRRRLFQFLRIAGALTFLILR
jgi:hypothetical protein